MNRQALSNHSASAAEISRNFGKWQSMAMMSPVVITHHGRDRLILTSVEEFEATRQAPDIGPEQPSVHGSGALLRAVLGQLRESFMVFDASMKIVDANALAELFVGLPRDQMIGKDLRDLVPGTAESIAWSHYKRVLNTGEPIEFFMRSSIHKGPKIFVRAFPYDGDCVGVLFTNMLAVEEAKHFQKRAESYKAAVEADPSLAMIRLNARGGIEEVDPAFCRMTAFSSTQLDTLMLVDIIHPSDRSILTRTLNNLIRDGAAQTTTVTVVARDGSEKRLRLNMSAATDEMVPEEVIVCVVDIDALCGDKGRAA